MAEIKLKNEGLPIRCEICHQRDFFDPLNNFCSRCSSLALNYHPQTSHNFFNYANLLSKCQKALKNLSLSIGEVSVIILMIFLTLLGALLSRLAIEFIEAFSYNLAHLGTILGAVLGFLSLFLIAKLVTIKTKQKLAPLIDLNIEILIKNSLNKK